MKIRLGTSVFLFLFVGGILSCNQDSQFETGCPYPSLAELDSVKQVFYSPYRNQQYSTKSDTVPFEEFRYHLEFEFEKIQRNNGFNEPPINPSCDSEFDVLGISNFAIILTAPYDGIQIGTDVSYLFLLPDGNSINRFREFHRMKQFMTLKIKEKPSKISQLNTEIIIYMVNGDRIKKSTISPFIRPD